MREVTTNVYKFEELDDRAKEKARDWYRQNALDYDWWDSVYEDAKQIGIILGIDMNHKGKDPCIWFSGFSSQGDGACFEGSYRYAKGASKEIRKYAPKDTELHRIADALTKIQRPAFYQLTATVRHSDRYYHAYSTTIGVNDRDGYEIHDDTENAIVEALRDFMNWIYRQLEKEHDYLMSDESVDENIKANEYEFTEEGERA